MIDQEQYLSIYDVVVGEKCRGVDAFELSKVRNQRGSGNLFRVFEHAGIERKLAPALELSTQHSLCPKPT